MIDITIHVYTFAELDEKAKRNAIEEHRSFLLDVLIPDYIDGVTDWNDPEKMDIYNQEYEHIQDHDDPVIESIESNEYLFYRNGDFCNAVTYTERHPRAGQTDITIHGETFTISEVTT